jgi:hypothetical protein
MLFWEMPKSLSVRGNMTTEIDFDGRSVEFFRRLRVLVRFECAEPMRQKPDGREDLSLQLVRVPEAVFSSATVAADLHGKLQIKSSTKESATSLAHGNRVHVERQMNVVRLLQKQFGEMESTVPDSPHRLVSEGGRKLNSFQYSGKEIAA